MSKKNFDKHQRFRNRVISFRLSPEEGDILNAMVAISGLTKQDFIINRLQQKEIKVYGGPRVYSAVKRQLEQVLEELQRIGQGENVSSDLLEMIENITLLLSAAKNSDKLQKTK